MIRESLPSPPTAKRVGAYSQNMVEWLCVKADSTLSVMKIKGER